MITKDQFIDSIRQETETCKHLFSKLQESAAEWRMGEGMRDNFELLRYLTFCAAAPTEALTSNDWSVVSRYQEAALTMPWDAFPARMETQLETVTTLLEDVPESDYLEREVQLPWGVTTTLGRALVETTLKFMAAYRLQLFCHAKAGGDSTLSTYNAWLGQDAPEPAGK